MYVKFTICIVIYGWQCILHFVKKRDGIMDKQMDGQMEGQTDGQTEDRISR